MRYLSKYRVSCWQGLELNAVGRQFEPYSYRRMRLHAGAPLWCDLGCCSRTVVVIKAAEKTSHYQLKRFVPKQSWSISYGDKMPFRDQPKHKGAALGAA